MLVRQPARSMTEPEKQAARDFLFGLVDGIGEQGKRQWRRFVGGLMRLEPGECVSIKTHRKRSLPFHRRHMLIETRVFEAQERFDSFEQFRCWLKVGSGFVDWCAGPKGGVVPIPKSIAFDRLEEGDAREVHLEMIAFLRGPHASKYLWPKLQPLAQLEMIETVLGEFDE